MWKVEYNLDNTRMRDESLTYLRTYAISHTTVYLVEAVLPEVSGQLGRIDLVSNVGPSFAKLGQDDPNVSPVVLVEFGKSIF